MAGQLPIDRARKAEQEDAKRFEEDKQKFTQKEAALKRKAGEYEEEEPKGEDDLEVERADREQDQDAEGED